MPDLKDVLFRGLCTWPPGTRLEQPTRILWEVAIRSIAMVNTSAEYSRNCLLVSPITDENGKLCKPCHQLT